MLNKRSASLICLVILAVASSAWAEKKAVTYRRNGNTITLEGEVTETEGGIEVKTDLGTIDIDREDLVSVEDIQSPEDEYAKRRAEIKDNENAKLLELAQWAIDKGLLARAKADIEQVLKNEPANIRASLLLQRINTLIEGNTGGDEDDDNDTGTFRGSKDLISLDDIYRIRREELGSKDQNLAIELRNNLAKRYVDSMKGQDDFRNTDFQRKFLSWPSRRQAAYILKHTKPGNAMRNDIIIRSDPAFMKEFTQTILPVVERNCAQSSCHGGLKAPGGLKLFNANTTRARYTNFVILDGVRNDKGIPIINRSTPEKSLLVQYLMPRDSAEFPHPTKLPSLFGRGDRKYREIISWINSLKRFPRRPDYNLEYKPPYGMKLIFRDTSSIQDLFPDKE
ncbi:MAG: tetratricopeptide repeat protein [Phycisphaerae bacterium]